MKISTLIFFSFLFILLLFSIATFINVRQSEKVKENANFLQRSFTVVRQSTRYQRNILNMISGWRGYMLTGEKYFIESYDSAATENDMILAELDSLLNDNHQEKLALNNVKSLHSQWTNEFTEPLLFAKQMSTRSDTALATFNKLYRQKVTSEAETELNTKLQNEMRRIINIEYQSRDVNSAILAASVAKTRKISFYLNLISVVLGSLIAGFLAYGISSRILKMVKMANSIAGGNYQVYVNVKGDDELSRLGKALNHMAKMLSENITLLKRKNTELDQFAHIVSHDLKTPLRGIDNVVTWMEEDHSAELSPKVKEYLGLIKGRVTRAENLIGGILSYARVDKETQPTELVDVKTLVEEVFDTTLVHSRLEIRIGSLPVIQTQRVPLEQVFSNLISNAVKYHDKKNGYISVYYKEHPEHYEFFVEDNGPGISQQYFKKIFQIFQTLHEGNGIDNTGVGLAIVKKILDERNQTIQLTSEPGKGSIFSFTWPK